MKNILLISTLIFGSYISAIGQKIMSEGSVVYQITVSNGKTEPGISDAFDGAVQTVWMKGDDVRIDFNSVIRKQSILYNGNAGTGVILKEAGAEKYMISLDKSQWQHYNRKYDGVQYSFDAGTKTVAGYACKQAVAKLADGSTMTIFYTTDIKPLVKDYDYAFTNLPGLALEYEVTTGNITINYKASQVSSQPVNVSKFDLPKSGYKMLTYKQ